MRRVYILTRTSNRPEMFKRLRKSIKELSGFEFVHVVHSDDPRAERYIDCEILVRGEALGKNCGSAPYNLYQNRLLQALRTEDPGWVHMIDDDDAYIAPDVFEHIIGDVEYRRDVMVICRSDRGPKMGITPKGWGGKNHTRFQTECFILPSQVATRERWWGMKGGDPNYTNKIITMHDPTLIWKDHVICRAMVGKGRGELIDLDGQRADMSSIWPEDREVWVKLQEKLVKRTYGEALVLESLTKNPGKVTYKGVEEIRWQNAKPAA